MPQDDNEAELFRQQLVNFHEARQRLEDLRNNFDNLKIVGSGVSGDSRKGFCINCPPCDEPEVGGTSGPPIPPPPPTPTGACCVGLDCTIETAVDCAAMDGVYQGDDSECDPNPCAAPAGACCRSEACTVEPQASCEAGGGVYQGDGVPCDPNPCLSPTCDCAFDAYDGSGRKFFTRNVTCSYSSTYNVSPPSPAESCTLTYNFTQEDNIDPITCVTTRTCSGSFTFDYSPAVGEPVHSEGDPCVDMEVGCSRCTGDCSVWLPDNLPGCGDQGCVCGADFVNCEFSGTQEGMFCDPNLTGNCTQTLSGTLSNECML